MSIATVTGFSESRDIQKEEGVGGETVALHPVEGSTRRAIHLTFPTGKHLKVTVSEQEYETFCALHRENMPSDEELLAERDREIETSKRARLAFIEEGHSCPVCGGDGLSPLGGPGSYWIEHGCGAYSQLRVTLEQAYEADWLVKRSML